MYEYNAKVLRVVDGDTVDVLIDVGFSTFKKERVRLHGINTPECRTRDLEEKKKGLAAKDRLETLIASCSNKCIIKTELDGDDTDSTDPTICLDTDADTCDDCSQQGSPNTSNDGTYRLYQEENS